MNIRITAVACLLSLGNPLFAQQATQTAPAPTAPTPSPNTLLDGTPIKLRLAENLTSATAKAGQQVSFEVAEEIDVMGVPVVLKGAPALATVTDASPKKSMGRGGKLDVNIDSVRLVDGEKAQLRAVQGGKGGGHTGAMTGAMVATAVVFWPAAPLFLFVHGKDIVIPKGTEITAFVEGDMRLDMAKMAPALAPAPSPTNVPTPAPVPAAVVPTTASLTVESSIPGADIEIDGEFAGNTPSTLTVTPGQHTIAVKKKGYADWSRTLSVAGTGIHLSADLEAKP